MISRLRSSLDYWYAIATECAAVTLPSRLLSLECTSNWMSIVCTQSWYMGTKASAHSVPHAFGSECPSHDCGLGQQALDMACGTKLLKGRRAPPNGEQREVARGNSH